jgi:hypothetical protein
MGAMGASNCNSGLNIHDAVLERLNSAPVKMAAKKAMAMPENTLRKVEKIDW